MIKQIPALLICLLVISGSCLAADTIPIWTGDFNKLVDHRVIRALVPYSKTYYFLDKAQPRGLTYEKLKSFENQINKDLEKRHLRVHLLIIPTLRDALIPDLLAGKGDIAAGNLTITDTRLGKVDFSNPLQTGVKEIIVTGPNGPKIKAIDDLSGKEVHIRASSSYFDSINDLNKQFKSKKKKRLKVVRVDEFLEDEDLLEMVNAGMIPMIVIDDHKAEFWAKIFNGIRLHTDIILRDKGKTAWAIRKNSPQLLNRINAFVKKSRKGTLLGNIMFERYLKNTRYVKNPGKGNEQFEQTTAIFQKYAKKYEFNWLLLKALAFQESGINQKKKSPRGAVGVMQILPSTAKDPNVNIPDIHLLDNNIHAGTKYLRFLKDRYFSEDKIDDRQRTLLALAAYNAGPRQTSRLRKEASDMGLDPNVWFKNVEVAAARRIGRETVQYVSNIMKYYITYSRMETIQNKKQGQ
ncbi:MAG: lytic transglycosylase F [Desulfobacterales bacterium]|nr:lytic transglycosylase F [Desulfobacterales bacterium]